MSYQNGAEWRGVLLTGFASGLCTFAGIGNFSGIEQTLANLGGQVFIDLVFCAGTNSMAAGVYNAVTPDTPVKDDAPAYNPTNIVPRPEPSAPAFTRGAACGSRPNLSSPRLVSQYNYVLGG